MFTKTTCLNCHGDHHIQACPTIRKMLMADTVLLHCNSCGDLTAADLCAACSEDALVDRFGISLELRQSVRATAAERVVGLPF